MILELILLLVTFLAYRLIKIKRAQQAWQKIGVPVPKIFFPLGNNPMFYKDVMLRRISPNEVVLEQYQEIPNVKYYGLYFLSSRVLAICDPDLAKDVLTRDFDHFTDRTAGSVSNMFSGKAESDQVFARQMSNAPGHLWKDVRSTFAPIFTSGKLKNMVPFIKDVCKLLNNCFEEAARKEMDIHIQDVLGKFTMDTIASCAFGVNARSFRRESESAFSRNAKNMFKMNAMDLAKYVLSHVPGSRYLTDFFEIGLMKAKETRFFIQVVRNTLKARREGKYRRNDLIDLMLDALDEIENNGHVVNEAHEDQFEADAKIKHKVIKGNLDELTIIANAFLILPGGYDTTSHSLAYCVYELAKNPDIQNSLQEEIDEAFKQNGGEFPDYYTIINLEYLDMVIHETLRMYPVLGFITRGCVKNYRIQDSNIEIKAGEEIHINVIGIHYDSKFYPNPSTFNPGNFSKEAKAKRHPYSYFGFGQGPRNCVGRRFALLEIKLALVSLLSKFSISTGPNTVDKIILDPKSILNACRDPILLRVKERH